MYDGGSTSWPGSKLAPICTREAGATPQGFLLFALLQQHQLIPPINIKMHPQLSRSFLHVHSNLCGNRLCWSGNPTSAKHMTNENENTQSNTLEIVKPHDLPSSQHCRCIKDAGYMSSASNLSVKETTMHHSLEEILFLP